MVDIIRAVLAWSDASVNQPIDKVSPSPTITAGPREACGRLPLSQKYGSATVSPGSRFSSAANDACIR